MSRFTDARSDPGASVRTGPAPARWPTTASFPRAAHRPAPWRRLRGWTIRHPAGGFIVLTYVISWPLFIAGALGGGGLLVVGGAFGPALAAATVTRWTGGSAGGWFRGLWRWHVATRWYAYALGLPPALVAMTVVEAAALGHTVDLGNPAGIAPAYLGTLVLVAVLGGGQEEPGWRGFLLDRCQQHHTPLAATMLLGLVWGAWHLPVYGLGGFAGPILLVTFYTWLFNRTGSVLLCVLLHAGFNTAIGYLDLANAGATVNISFFVTAALGASALVAATRGRLGVDTGRVP